MILDRVISDGITPKKKTQNEFSSPCPACGGTDRFLIWPESNRYWCRQCDTKGDEIQYLRDFHGMEFKDAAEVVGKRVTHPSCHDRLTNEIKDNLRQEISGETSRKKIQPEKWVENASRIIASAHIELLGDKQRMDWLERERGLASKTIKQFRLGWLANNQFYNKKYFGLDPDGKKLFLPSGLVIPWRDIRIRIRRDNPGDYARYHVVSGSRSDAFTIGSPYDNTAIVVESELDAILLSQEIEREVFIVALGSAHSKPNKQLLDRLNQAVVILVALDADDAGATASQWWMDHAPNSYRTLTPKQYGKDITESFLNGLDLNEWLGASLELCAEDISDTEKTDHWDSPQEEVDEVPALFDDAGGIDPVKWITAHLEELSRAGFTHDDLFSTKLPIGIAHCHVWDKPFLDIALEGDTLFFAWTNPAGQKISQRCRPENRHFHKTVQ